MDIPKKSSTFSKHQKSMRIIMRPTLCLLTLISIAFSSVHSQGIEFPQPLYPGEKITIPAGYDTLYWLLKNSQYNKAIQTAKKLEIADATIDKFEANELNYKNLIAEKDSMIQAYKKGYDHYKVLWEETDVKLEKAEIKNLGQWRMAFTGFYLGTILTILAGAAISIF
jgi:hypothetical protein